METGFYLLNRLLAAILVHHLGTLIPARVHLLNVIYVSNSSVTVYLIAPYRTFTVLYLSVFSQTTIYLLESRKNYVYSSTQENI